MPLKVTRRSSLALVAEPKNSEQVISGQLITCSLFFGSATNASDDLRVTFNGITNPSVGAKTVDVSTTSDTATVTSSPYNVAAANPLTGLTVANGAPSN